MSVSEIITELNIAIEEVEKKDMSQLIVYSIRQDEEKKGFYHLKLIIRYNLEDGNDSYSIDTHIYPPLLHDEIVSIILPLSMYHIFNESSTKEINNCLVISKYYGNYAKRSCKYTFRTIENTFYNEDELHKRIKDLENQIEIYNNCLTSLVNRDII